MTDAAQDKQTETGTEATDTSSPHLIENGGTDFEIDVSYKIT